MDKYFTYEGYEFIEDGSEDFYDNFKQAAQEIVANNTIGLEPMQKQQAENDVLDSIINAVFDYIYLALEENAGKPLNEWEVDPQYIKTLMASVDFLDQVDEAYTKDYDVEDRYENIIYVFQNPKTNNLFGYECDFWLYGYREMDMNMWYPVEKKKVEMTIFVRKNI